MIYNKTGNGVIKMIFFFRTVCDHSKAENQTHMLRHINLNLYVKTQQQKLIYQK